MIPYATDTLPRLKAAGFNYPVDCYEKDYEDNTRGFGSPFVVVFNEDSTRTIHLIQRQQENPSITSRLWKSLFDTQVVHCFDLKEFYIRLLQCQFEYKTIDANCFIPHLERNLYPNEWGKCLSDYTSELVSKGIIDPEIRETALNIVAKLKNSFSARLIEPDAASGPDNSLMIAFDDGTNHLEFEIIERNQIEVFFLNRDSNYTWEAELNDKTSFPIELLDNLKSFLHLQ